MAQGYYGTEETPYSSLTAESIVLTPRTSDPSNPSQGDWWFRSDLDSGDRTGTVRWYDGITTNDVPVFSTGDSGTGVEEVVRLQTPNGLSFIPVADLSQYSVAYPQFRVQHNGSIHGWHDGVAAVPDSVVYQWTAANFADPWPADVGGVDMSLAGDLQTTTLSNGDDAVEGDGSDDAGWASIEDIGPSLDQSALEFSVQSSGFGSGWWGSNATAVGEYTYNIRFDNDADLNTDTGNFAVLLRGDNDDDLRFSPSSNPNLDDGSVHNVSIILNDTTANDADIIIDGSSVSLSFTNTESPSFSSNLDDDWGFFARRNNGSSDNHVSAAHGIFRFHDESISSQTI